MRELLTTQIVAEGIGKLVVAFPGNLAAKTNPAMLADTYRRGLEGLDGDAVRAAIDICIREDVYFPKVARLREVAGEWTRRNRFSVEARIEERWDVCRVCGARAKQEMITRPLLHDRGGAEHYVTTKGEKIPRRDLLLAQQGGAVFVMETVLSERTVINHDANRHHVRQGEEGEYEAAS